MKLFWKIIIAVAIIGAIICAAGFVAGAKLSMYRDGMGWHLSDGRSESFKETFEKITELDINSNNGIVEVKAGNEYSIEVIYYEPKPSVSCENGILIFNGANHFFNFGFGLNTDKVIITLPENAKLSKATIDNDNGRIMVANLNAATIHIENDNGKIELQSITADSLNIVSRNGAMAAHNITADSLDMRNNNGEILFGNIVAGTGMIRVNNGQIRGSYITGNHNIKVNNGRIDLVVADLNDYYITSSVRNGSTNIGGQRTNVFGEKNAKYSFDLQVNNGSVKVSQ